MSAGQPNWQKLHEMGKLPANQHRNIPALVKLDAANDTLTKFKDGCCDACRAKFFAGGDQGPSVVTVKCEVDGCDYVAKGKSEAIAKNILRLHSKSHEPKQ